MNGLLGRRKSRNDVLVSYVIQWLFLAAGVWVADKLLDGVELDGWKSLLIVAGILALLNLVLKPFLQAVSLPLTILTFGLFLVVINTALVALTARIAYEYKDDVHFTVVGIPGDFLWEGFKNSFLAALIISAVSFVLGLIFGPVRISRRLLG